MSNEKLKQCADFLENLVIPGFKYNPGIWTTSCFFPLVKFGLLDSVQFNKNNQFVAKTGPEYLNRESICKELDITENDFTKLFTEPESFKGCAAKIRNFIKEAEGLDWTHIAANRGWYAFHSSGDKHSRFHSEGDGKVMIMQNNFIYDAEPAWKGSKFRKIPHQKFTFEQKYV